MKKTLIGALLTVVLTGPLFAASAANDKRSPTEITDAAPSTDWIAIAPEELLVMTLASDAEGRPRQVVIQLSSAPFNQGWARNIRLLARSRWYDGLSINRTQDNYVTQWGDKNYDNPEASGATKPLPDGLEVLNETAYTADAPLSAIAGVFKGLQRDPYAENIGFVRGFPVGYRIVSPSSDQSPNLVRANIWPVHCYGMVGAGRNLSPDAGSGGELYAVIGHAPRHLDRNIALVGRVIAGIEHLSSLPRGSGALGFYTDKEATKRVTILSVRVASDLPVAEQPRFEYLSTESKAFSSYVSAIANRHDPFFILPSGGTDICNARVPVRLVKDAR
jgi:cyclophilin family peptidyl-prolyl cis-trans isomerase